MARYKLCSLATPATICFSFFSCRVRVSSALQSVQVPQSLPRSTKSDEASGGRRATIEHMRSECANISIAKRAPPARLERATYGLAGALLFQLSYGGTGTKRKYGPPRPRLALSCQGSAASLGLLQALAGWNAARAERSSGHDSTSVSSLSVGSLSASLSDAVRSRFCLYHSLMARRVRTVFAKIETEG